MQKTMFHTGFFRIFAFLLAVLAVLTTVALPAQADEAVSISTVEELLAMADAPEKDYVLAADLDLSGIDHVPFPFAGNFDGGGHMLLNLTVNAPAEEKGVTFDGNDIDYDTVFAGLFSTLTEATVTDLVLVNPRLEIDTAENCFAGCLAGFMENSVITGVNVVNGYVSLTQSAYNSGTAGLVGFGSGQFSDCGFSGTLIFSDTNREENCESFLGGICATGMVDVTGCTVELDAYASVCGYAHSGGLVGMFYDPEWLYTGTCTGNTVSGRILFYEYNPYDRRAYCEAFIGEELGSVELYDNNDEGYSGVESEETDGLLLPENHSGAEYTAEIVPPTCTECGYTEYTCEDCGYVYRDEYTLPAHVPGEPQTVIEATLEEEGVQEIYCSLCATLLSREAVPAHVEGNWMMLEAPGYDTEGVMCLLCADCGEVLETQTVAPLIAAESITLDRREITLRYKGTDTLQAELLPANTAIPTVTWTTSDAAVVTVDADGNLTAGTPGTAVITCASDDGMTESTCTVTVRYTWWQWIIRTVLFGFLWY